MWRGALAAPRPKGPPDAAQTAFSARPPRRAHSGDPRALRRRSNGSDRRDARVARTKSLAQRRRGPLDAAHRVAGRRTRGRAGARVRRGALAVERPHDAPRAEAAARSVARADRSGRSRARGPPEAGRDGGPRRADGVGRARAARARPRRTRLRRRRALGPDAASPRRAPAEEHCRPHRPRRSCRRRRCPRPRRTSPWPTPCSCPCCPRTRSSRWRCRPSRRPRPRPRATSRTSAAPCGSPPAAGWPLPPRSDSAVTDEGTPPPHDRCPPPALCHPPELCT